jgi:peptide/nickel transport system substrate-binding protein
MINLLIRFQPVRLLIALCLSSVLFFTSACQSSQFRTLEAQGSELRLVSPSNPTTFNYPLNQSPFGVFSYIYEPLVSQNGITNEIEPALAESWQISENHQRITFTLRENLQWSDGEPLTVDDVMFTFQDIFLNQEIPTVFRDFLRIGRDGTFPSIQKVSDRQFEFILPEPFAPFLRYITRLVILPAHALRESVDSRDANGQILFLSTWGTDTDPKNIIGNGPYRMVSYTPSERVMLERNPYYWRKDAQGNPQPYIDRLVVQIIESSDNQLLRFRSGELDTLRVKPEAFRLLKQGEKRGQYTLYSPGHFFGYNFVGFNLNQAQDASGNPFVDPIKAKWFNNLAFRQAVAYAIDREKMNINIYRGLGVIQHSPIAVQSPYYLSPEQGLKVYNYDPRKAKTMLLNAGFEYNEQKQLLDWDGNPIEFTILVKSEDSSRVDTAVQIQKDLSKIGIQANLQVISFNVVIKKLLFSRDWDCYVGAFGVQGADIEPNLMSLFWKSNGSFHQFNQGPQPKQPPIQNWQVSDWEQEIDNLFEAAAKELDERKRQEIYAEFQQIVAEQLPVFFLVNSLYIEAVRDRIQNLKVSATRGAFWNLYELKINQPD